MRVIGLMSGTSYDAVDAAAADVRLDGDVLRLRPLGMVSERYPDEVRELLAAALPPAAVTLAEVCRLDTRIGQVFAAAAVRADRELCGGRADLVASHGQTVYHWTDGTRAHGTLQLGQPAWIAEATGLPVVADFRPRDIAAGGQGAPLVGLFDTLWLRGRPGTPVALNVGGIANLTAPDGTAFDTGPGCALIDAAARGFSGGRLEYDAEGRLAAAGRVHPGLLDLLLTEPYYSAPPPKTTGKELFHPGYLRDALAGVGATLAAEDVIATLTALTARTVADAVRAVGATEVLASGGGTRNPALTAMLADALPGVPVRPSDALGLPSDAKEAYAFAVLGCLTVHALPGTTAAGTGARHPSVLGSVTPGAHGFPYRAPVEGGGPRRLIVEAV
ncbi:anhydro-N-acetylmuramic acid kinase [Streptomyces sp. NPDC004610]|uniref:anhydro-N-acetylmuramic acid kinase n=1 Tax=unclassified Streptomyces TaxID=2593676 RepID=UPI0033ADC5A6